MNENTTKSIVFSIIVTAITLVFCLFAAEVLLRVKNSDGKNYHIEMWKYSRDLKQASQNPILGHEHLPSSQAKLQNVIIRTNKNGMRGAAITPVKSGQRRILLLGSSATLGWGVEEEETMSSRLQLSLGEGAVVMNAGIGNYNTKRYVELFLTKNRNVTPTDIIVNYYLNDAEVLKPGGGGSSFVIVSLRLLFGFYLTVSSLKPVRMSSSITTKRFMILNSKV